MAACLEVHMTANTRFYNKSALGPPCPSTSYSRNSVLGFRIVFNLGVPLQSGGRFSAKLGPPQTLLERWGSSCSVDYSKNHPARPILGPFCGTNQKTRPDCLGVPSTVGSSSCRAIHRQDGSVNIHLFFDTLAVCPLAISDSKS